MPAAGQLCPAEGATGDRRAHLCSDRERAAGGRAGEHRSGVALGGRACGPGVEPAADVDVGAQSEDIAESDVSNPCGEASCRGIHGQSQATLVLQTPAGVGGASALCCEDHEAADVARQKVYNSALSGLGTSMAQVEDAAVGWPPQPLSWPHSRHVRFDLAAVTLHEIPPYSEIYGHHPNTFVFDRHSCRVPAAPNGYVSLAAIVGEDDEEEPSDTSDDDDEEIVFYGKGGRLAFGSSEASVGTETWDSYLNEAPYHCNGFVEQVDDTSETDDSWESYLRGFCHNQYSSSPVQHISTSVAIQDSWES